jgi:uncharacterized protein
MDEIFIDSDAFIALNDTSDSLHKKATKTIELLVKKRSHLYTSTHIILEVTTIISQHIGHNQAINFLELVRDGNITILHLTKETVLNGEKIFKKQTSKNVSLADCWSFSIMNHLNIKEAFTFDKDFKKNGFTLITE